MIHTIWLRRQFRRSPRECIVQWLGSPLQQHLLAWHATLAMFRGDMFVHFVTWAIVWKAVLQFCVEKYPRQNLCLRAVCLFDFLYSPASICVHVCALLWVGGRVCDVCGCRCGCIAFQFLFPFCLAVTTTAAASSAFSCGRTEASV